MSFRLLFFWTVMSSLLLNVHAQQLNFISSIPNDAVVVLYDNNPYGETQGYAKMAGLRNCVKERTTNIAVVSCGDFLGGNPLSAITNGSSSCRMINAVGSDFVTLGNHEFDYDVSAMYSLLSHVTPEILCCNFREMRSSYSYRGVRHQGVRRCKGGGCRGPIQEGKVPVENIYTTFSFVNTVLVDMISGWELLDVLEWGVETRIPDDGGFLDVSGLTCCVDMNAKASVKVNEQYIEYLGGTIDERYAQPQGRIFLKK